MSPDECNRRRFLRLLGGSLVATTAGCLDGGTGTATETRAATTTDRSTTGQQPGTQTNAVQSTTTDEPAATESRPATAVARSLIDQLMAQHYDAAQSSFASSAGRRYSERGLKRLWKKQQWFVDGVERVRSTTIRSESSRASTVGTTTTAAGPDTTATDTATETVVVHLQGNAGRIEATVTVGEGGVTDLSFSLAQVGSYTLPDYARAARYTERSVTVDAGTGYPLPGTITLPTDRDGPVPGIVLVHGSGPQDRNETIGPQQPFKDLALGLASRGVAVLRYRKRTKEYTIDDVPKTKLTPEWIVGADARAAVRKLRDQPGVLTDGVGVFGHSLGGYLGPMIADRSDHVAALALANAPGNALWRSNYYQLRQLFAWDGTVTDTEQSTLDRIERVGNRVSTSGFPANRRVFGQYGAFWNAVTDYDPTAVAAELSIPVTVRQGGHDIQVPPESNTRAWRNGLAGHTNATVERHPALNHLLLPTDGHSYLGKYYTVPRNVSRSVITQLKDLPAFSLSV